MTIHLPGRAAAAAEVAPDLARIMAEQAEREAAEVALHTRNKEVLFDGLRLVGIAHVLVSFDGSGDSGQLESIDARNDLDASVTLPAAQITFASIDWQSGAPTERRLTLEGAVEELVYDLLSDTHSGWQDNDGAYGEFCIDARARTIHLEFNERFTSSELYTHDF
ncbi:DUF6878 family protein [Stagnihabitans tardus]|jgi:hypothetical protein|uniref:DUF6878 domain-containing protein n=1 Tax=Stagnihabitans tardus TaxID=2699202 RepID=A0AAE5BX37_9RHOB|nr:DUF6878 family protein [Stagnihabitans tardus]NBZ88893.1 hypothetical protein [Stagnihabitans tardus]